MTTDHYTDWTGGAGLFIPGQVRGQGSLQLYRGKHGQEVARHPQTTVAWRNHVIARLEEWHRPMPAWTSPLTLEVMAVFARPKSHFGTGRNADRLKDSAPTWHDSSYPDLDKVVRLVGDAAVYAGVVDDDRRFVRIVATKRWTRPDLDRDDPGLWVQVKRLW